MVIILMARMCFELWLLGVHGFRFKGYGYSMVFKVISLNPANVASRGAVVYTRA